MSAEVLFSSVLFSSVLFSSFQFAGILFQRQLYAATAALGARVEAGPLKDRILALAEAAKTKVRRVYLIPDNPWKRVETYSVGDGSIAGSSAALGHFSRREMDALLARDVAWLAASVDRNLMAKHVLGMFAGFLYAWYAAWSMKPEWVEVLIGLGLIGVNGSLARLRASASEDRPAGREPHRRSRGPDHRAGKTRTRKSTRHRREFEKPAEIDRENSRYR